MLRRLLPLLAALALIGAGCGDDDDGNGGGATNPTTPATTATASGEARAYQTQVQTILGTVGTAGRTLGSSVQRGSSLSDVARALETFQGSIERAASRLEDLSPPVSEAQEGQDELTSVLRDLASGVQDSIDAARQGDRASFTRVFRRYQQQLDGQYRRRLTSAGEKIDRALAGR